MDRRKTVLATSLPLVVLLVAAFVLDLLAAASTSLLFIGGVGALGAVAAGVVWVASRRAECLLALLPFAALLALLAVADTSPVKPFARFYAAVEPGMTEEEVLKALDHQFPATGRYPRPLVNRRVGPTHLAFILDPQDGRYDSEIVALELEAGRVVRKRYYPD
jgi:hypothetical protein